MMIKVYGHSNWAGEVISYKHSSPDFEGWFNVIINVRGPDAEEGLNELYDLHTKDRITMIRTPKEIRQYQDYQTREPVTQGFARFMFRLTPGPHKMKIGDE